VRRSRAQTFAWTVSRQPEGCCGLPFLLESRRACCGLSGRPSWRWPNSDPTTRSTRTDTSCRCSRRFCCGCARPDDHCSRFEWMGSRCCFLAAVCGSPGPSTTSPGLKASRASELARRRGPARGLAKPSLVLAGRGVLAVHDSAAVPRPDGGPGGPVAAGATLASTFALQTLSYPRRVRRERDRSQRSALGIVEACSGLTMLVTFFALATAVAILVRRPGLTGYSFWSARCRSP
jgi:hypothetical protein